MNIHENNDHSQAGASEINMSAGRLQPISGWPLKHIAVIENASPGYLWKLMATRPQWRHATFAAFTRGILDDPEPFLNRVHGWIAPHETWSECIAEVGATLLRLRPREIIDAAFGSCPNGLNGLLDKCGFDALAEDIYARLHAIYASTDPAIRARKRCLEQLPDFQEGYLAAVETLDPVFLTPGIVRRYQGHEAAARLNGSVSMIRLLVSTADDTAIRDSLEKEERRPFPGWFSRWLQRSDQPLPRKLPTDGIDFLERITPSTARSIGHQFGNCLGRDPDGLSTQMCSGVMAMLVWREAGLLIEIVQAEDDSWFVRRVHARQNAQVTRDNMRDVREVLEPVGIKVVIVKSSPPELEPLLRELGSWRMPLFDLMDFD